MLHLVFLASMLCYHQFSTSCVTLEEERLRAICACIIFFFFLAFTQFRCERRSQAWALWWCGLWFTPIYVEVGRDFFFLTGRRNEGTWDPLLVNYLEKQPTFKITGLELNCIFQWSKRSMDNMSLGWNIICLYVLCSREETGYNSY